MPTTIEEELTILNTAIAQIVAAVVIPVEARDAVLAAQAFTEQKANEADADAVAAAQQAVIATTMAGVAVDAEANISSFLIATTTAIARNATMIIEVNNRTLE